MTDFINGEKERARLALEAGDYGGLIHVSPSDAQAAIETADRILALIIPMC